MSLPGGSPVMHDMLLGLGAAAAGAVAAACMVSPGRGAAGKVEEASAKCGEQLPGMRRNVHGGCIYLDWNATSPIFPEVTAEMLPYTGAVYAAAAASSSCSRFFYLLALSLHAVDPHPPPITAFLSDPHTALPFPSTATLTRNLLRGTCRRSLR
jgi:hypothetical protein